jgi:putative endonuclease
MYFVYALYSKEHDKIYIGSSSDPEKRLLSHNNPLNKGWTSRYIPWIIILCESFDSKTEALVRENQLKTAKGRQYIRSLIKAQLV